MYSHSAHTLGAGRIVFGFNGNGTSDRSLLKNFALPLPYYDTGFAEIQRPALSSFNYIPFIGAGVTDFFDVSITLPMATDMVGNFFEAGMGDVCITSKLSAHSSDRLPFFDIGVVGAMSLATGNATKGYFPRHPYYFNEDSLALETPKYVPTAYFSSKKSDFEARAAVTLDLGALQRPIPLSFHADCGMHFTTHSDNDHAVLFGGAIEYHPFRALGLFTEFNSEMRLYNVTHGFSMTSDPLHITQGMTIAPQNGLMFTMGGEFSCASSRASYSYIKMREASQFMVTGIEPKWRIFAQVGWSGLLTDRDRDRDGIIDRDDSCPTIPEDVDGYQDDNGCPEYDNDKDGVADSLDQCPNDAEDCDCVQDKDGCPENDNDNDRIIDSLDQCPNDAEDHDGFQDKDGCPDDDNDADKAPDSVDRCQTIPEDYDGFEDGDGCPDPDNDGDGVPDSLDKCPNQAGNGKKSGCPRPEADDSASEGRVKEIKRGRVILRGMAFEGGSAMIDPVSFPILDRVTESLVQWPQVRIEIQGHTDEAGTAEANIELSEKRAEAVREYIISKGIEPHRLSATGKGDGDPVADNSTLHGRSLNNRIEFRRTDP